MSMLRTPRRSALSTAGTNGGTIRVRGGFIPNVLLARCGRPIEIVFIREESAPCSEYVIFPSFGKSAMLPRGARIVVELPPSPPGSYEFTCSMKVLRGTLVVQ